MIQNRGQNPDQLNFLHADWLDQLNPRHPLLKLARDIPWDYFETECSPLYSDQGRPAKPVRLMVGFSILKHLEELSSVGISVRPLRHDLLSKTHRARRF